MALIDNLIAYWSLGEASGNALDSHGANHLNASASAPGAATGLVGGARDFEQSTSQRFSATSGTALSTGDIDFTIAAWVKIESFGTTTRGIVGKFFNASVSNKEFLLGTAASPNRFTFGVVNTSVTNVVVATTDTLALDTWYHVVGWHDSVNDQIGISLNDGTPVLIANTDGVQNRPAELFLIGAQISNALTHFDGLIDEVGFWKRKLTATERTQLYNGGAGLAYPLTVVGGVPNVVNASLRLSGGVSNVNPLVSLGGAMSTTMVKSQRVSGASIPGVAIVQAGGNSVGSGTLEFVASPPSLEWIGPGAASGAAQDLVDNGQIILEDISGGMLTVKVVLSNLPVANASATLTVTNRRYALFDALPDTTPDVGYVDYRCIYIINENATVHSTLSGILVYTNSGDELDFGTIEIGFDPAGVGNGFISGVATTIASPTTAPTGITFDEYISPPDILDDSITLAPGEAIALWIKRTVPVGTEIEDFLDSSELVFEIDFAP